MCSLNVWCRFSVIFRCVLLDCKFEQCWALQHLLFTLNFLTRWRLCKLAWEVELVHSFLCEAECLLQGVEVCCLPTFNWVKTTGPTTCGKCKNVKYPKLNDYFESANIHSGLWRDAPKILSQKEIKKILSILKVPCRYGKFTVNFTIYKYIRKEK